MYLMRQNLQVVHQQLRIMNGTLEMEQPERAYLLHMLIKQQVNTQLL